MFKKFKNKNVLAVMVILLMIIFAAACGSGESENETGETDNQGHEHNESLVEWRGVYSLEAGEYTLSFEDAGDSSMMIAFFDESEYTGEYDIEDAHHAALHLLEEDLEEIEAESALEVKDNTGYKLILDPEGTAFELEVPEEGAYVAFTEHVPAEFNMQLTGESGDDVEPHNVKEYEGGHDHEHEEEDHDDHDDEN